MIHLAVTGVNKCKKIISNTDVKWRIMTNAWGSTSTNSWTTNCVNCKLLNFSKQFQQFFLLLQGKFTEISKFEVQCSQFGFCMCCLIHCQTMMVIIKKQFVRVKTSKISDLILIKLTKNRNKPLICQDYAKIAVHTNSNY